MEASEIINEYRAFLSGPGYGANDKPFGTRPCDCPRCRTNRTSPIEWVAAEDLRRAVAGSDAVLNDAEVVRLHGREGEHFVEGLHLTTKVRCFETLLPEILDDGYETIGELGTATGYLLQFLASRQIVAAKLTGIDANPEHLRYGREQAAGLGVDIDFIEAWANNTGLPDQSFDFTFSVALLDCSPGWREMLAEMVRITRMRLAVCYAMHSHLRIINPWDVMAELSKHSMVADTPKHIRLDNSVDDHVLVTASRPEYVPESQRGLILVQTIQV